MTVTSARGSSFKVTSTCPEFTGISYVSALKGSNTTPCTNVPVVCELCVHPTNSKSMLAIWRYNLNDHIKALHPGHTRASQLSPKFLELINISTKEQRAMGIPQEQIRPTSSFVMAINPLSSPCGIKCRADTSQPSPQRTKSARNAESYCMYFY